MDFTESTELTEIVAKVRAFMAEAAPPLERELAERGSFRACLPSLEAARQRVRELGLFAPQLPRQWGGMGLDLMAHGRLSEELGRSPLGHYLFNCQAPDAGNMEILLKYGTPEQKERWLGPLAAGTIRSCFAMTEPGRAGSNPTWLDTTAVRDGDDWVIQGRKWFTSSADGAAVAVVMAVTDPGAAPHLRASQILVPLDTPGFRLVRNIPVMGHVGDDWASHGEVTFTDCRVPVANTLGPEGMGFVIAQERLGPGRIHHCMRWIGVCERSFDMMCEYAARRELAPGKPLGTKQIIQEWIAESRADIDAARLMVQNAAWQIETKGQYEAREAISLIKFFVANVMQRVVDRAVQTHGGLGVTDDTVLSFFFRGERAARIYDGADEVHKSAVAKRILKRHGLKLS